MPRRHGKNAPKIGLSPTALSFEAMRKTEPRRLEMLSALAAARYYLAERHFETLLALRFPSRLNFSSRSSRMHSLALLKGYLKAKAGLLEEARGHYQGLKRK